MDVPTPGPTFKFLEAGRAKAKIICRSEAPLEETKFKVLVELIGSSSCNDRLGVDIVMVLDTNFTMDEKKLAKLKTAMVFLIKKLSPKDRLSVVTYCKKAERRCPLLRMTKNSQAEIEKLINDLPHKQGTDTNTSANINDGLQLATLLLNSRRLTDRRVPAIMLVSGSSENYNHPISSRIPVYTFGFGGNFNCRVLNDIAMSSGGTFSMVDFRDTSSSNLSIAFSQCLAGLLTVVAQELKLTITAGESKIENVSAGSYLLPVRDFSNTVTISFGNLYSQETRKVMVEVILPPLSSRSATEVLKFTHSYRTSTGEEPFEANPMSAIITRTNSPPGQEMEDIIIEETRLKTVYVMKTARALGDTNKFDECQNKLVEAQNMLEDVNVRPSPSLEMIKYELYELVKLMQSPEIYNRLGCAFALAAVTSHDQQRFATRADPSKLRMFNTQRMDKYVEQVNSYERNTNILMPSTADDEKEETAKDPSSAVHIALLYYFEQITHSLKAVQIIVNACRQS